MRPTARPLFRPASVIPALLALLSLVASPLSADEVYLKDGRVLDGEVISPAGADQLKLRTTGNGSMVVVQHFQMSQVAKVVYGKSARQKSREAVAARRAELGEGGEAEDWWALAEQAREVGDTVLARELAGEVVARDRHHPAARRALGMVLQNGIWMRPGEAAVARGEILHNGRFMSWQEREEAVEQQAQREEQAAAKREAREARRLASRYTYSGIDPYPATHVPGSRTGPYYPYNSAYPRYQAIPGRVIFWGTPYPPHHPPSHHGHGHHGGGLSVHGTGGGSHHRWSINWN